MVSSNQNNNRGRGATPRQNTGPGGRRDARNIPAPVPAQAPNQPAPIAQPGPITPSPPSDWTLPPLLPTPGAGTALPQGNFDNPFFDPRSNYIPAGSQGANVNFFGSAGDPNPTTMGNIYGTTESPEGYYYAVLNQQGLGGLDARSRAAQSMYGDYSRGYQAAKMFNSELMFPQFMQMQNVPGLVQMLSDEQLGIDRNQYRGALNWTLRG